MNHTSEAFLTRRTRARHGEVGSVIFAIRPRSYSEAISETIAALRPALDVSAVGPDVVASEATRRTPALVFSGDPKPLHLSVAVRWGQYRPYEDPDVVRLDGIPHRFPGLGLEDLLMLIDDLCGGAPEA